MLVLVFSTPLTTPAKRSPRGPARCSRTPRIKQKREHHHGYGDDDLQRLGAEPDQRNESERHPDEGSGEELGAEPPIDVLVDTHKQRCLERCREDVRDYHGLFRAQ